MYGSAADGVGMARDGLRRTLRGEIGDRQTMCFQEAFHQLSCVTDGERKSAAGVPLQPGHGHRMNAALRGYYGRPGPPHGYRIFDNRMHLDHPKG
jgi:hypothetical protein